MHPQWEYSVLKLPTKTPFLTGTDLDDVQFGKHLNAFGAEGWEVVSVTGIQMQDGRTNYVLAVMKRPKG